MSWVFIVITWYASANGLPGESYILPYTQEIPARTEASCTRMMKSIRTTYKEAQEDDPRFGFIVECKEKT